MSARGSTMLLSFFDASAPPRHPLHRNLPPCRRGHQCRYCADGVLRCKLARRSPLYLQVEHGLATRHPGHMACMQGCVHLDQLGHHRGSCVLARAGAQRPHHCRGLAPSVVSAGGSHLACAGWPFGIRLRVSTGDTTVAASLRLPAACSVATAGAARVVRIHRQHREFWWHCGNRSFGKLCRSANPACSSRRLCFVRILAKRIALGGDMPGVRKMILAFRPSAQSGQSAAAASRIS